MDQSTCGGPAWIINDNTGESIRCNGYLKGDHEVEGPILPVVTATTCVQIKGEDPFLLRLNQACYYDDPRQDESLCLPFQAMGHGVTFDLTPKCRLRPDGLVGEQKLTVEGRNIPLEFDGRKMYLNVRTPSEQELLTLNTYELTSPAPLNPEESIFTQRDRKRKYNSYSGGLTM